MPVTKGAGNPDWTLDETLLALDLLYRHGAPLSKTHSDVGALSTILRAAHLFPIENRKENFRNGDGVALKMQNLQSALNPERRLSSSKTDRAAVAEFPPQRKLELAAIAAVILGELSRGTAIEDVPEERTVFQKVGSLQRHIVPETGVCDASYLINATTKHLYVQSAISRRRISTDTYARAFLKHITSYRFHSSSARPKLASATWLSFAPDAIAFVHRLISTRKRWVGIDDARSHLNSAK